MKYDGPPRRSVDITERERRANDIKYVNFFIVSIKICLSVWCCRIDETMKVVFSIDVFLSEVDSLATGHRQEDDSEHTEEIPQRVRENRN